MECNHGYRAVVARVLLILPTSLVPGNRPRQLSELECAAMVKTESQQIAKAEGEQRSYN